MLKARLEVKGNNTVRVRHANVNTQAISYSGQTCEEEGLAASSCRVAASNQVGKDLTADPAAGSVHESFLRLPCLCLPISPRPVLAADNHHKYVFPLHPSMQVSGKLRLRWQQ